MDAYREFNLVFRIQLFIIFFALQLGNFRFFPTLFYLVIFEAVFFGIVYLIKNFSRGYNSFWVNEDKVFYRKAALEHAKTFLSPYKSIWKNIKLSNKFCTVKLGETSTKIRVSEKVHPYRHFDVVKSYVHSYEDLWNMFCNNFEYNTTYDEMVRNCRIFKVTISETVSEVASLPVASEIIQQTANSQKMETIDVSKPVQKIDINNCGVIYDFLKQQYIDVSKSTNITKSMEHYLQEQTLYALWEYTSVYPDNKFPVDRWIFYRSQNDTLYSNDVNDSFLNKNGKLITSLNKEYKKLKWQPTKPLILKNK